MLKMYLVPYRFSIAVFFYNIYMLFVMYLVLKTVLVCRYRYCSLFLRLNTQGVHKVRVHF